MGRHRHGRSSFSSLVIARFLLRLTETGKVRRLLAARGKAFGTFESALFFELVTLGQGVLECTTASGGKLNFTVAPASAG